MAGAQLSRNERTAEAPRSMASTMPADPPFGSHAWLSDRPSWCVDVGPKLVAMTTCDLWLGLAKGEIRPEMKVWREGMAHWLPVQRVPEFALAMPDAKVWSPAPGAVTAKLIAAMPKVASAADPARATAHERVVAQSASEGPSLHERAAQAVGLSTLAPPSDFATPAPVIVEQAEALQVPGARSKWFPRLDKRGAMSVVAGAVVAITALAIATTGPTPDDGRPAAGVRTGTFVPDHSAVSFERPAFSPPFEPAASALENRGAAPSSVVVQPSPSQSSQPASASPSRLRRPRGPIFADRGQRRSRASSK